MPRPREFDAEVVLDRAVEFFWKHGYESASMEALVTHLGINRSSLYAAFGGKRELYGLAVARYGDELTRGCLAALDAPLSPLAGLRALVRYVRTSVGDGKKHGCLLTKTALELARTDVQARKQVAQYFTGLEDAVCRRITEGQARGEIGDHARARVLARGVLATLQGLIVLSVAHTEPTVLRDVEEAAIAALR